MLKNENIKKWFCQCTGRVHDYELSRVSATIATYPPI